MVEHERTGLVDFLTWRFSRLAMILPAVIVVIMFYEVVMRYVFAKPTLWVNEMSLWLGGMIYLLAGLYAMQQRTHIRIYIIYDMMPGWARKGSDLVSVLLIVGFAVALVWGGYTDALNRFSRMETFGTAWDPPIPGRALRHAATQPHQNFYYLRRGSPLATQNLRCHLRSFPADVCLRSDMGRFR